MLKKEKQEMYERKLEPMSMEELNHIINNAEDDSINERLTSAPDLRNKIESWD